MDHPPPSSSRSPRQPRLSIGGRCGATRMAAATQHMHQAPAPPTQQMPAPDTDRSGVELRALDCNLSALCDHIQREGFNSGAFSDVVVCAMGSSYHLHRLILSRSSYFRNMLHGPWKEAGAATLTLQIDDDNVNLEAITMALAYLYGHHPKLNDNNAFRVLAAASFLDLQDLCAICTDFIISELWTSNFLAYQVFAESQDYGMHGERVRKACWGYLCQSGTMELREVLPKLSSHTLHSLLTSDKLWVPNEEKRFELALFTLLAKSALLKEDHANQIGCTESGYDIRPDSSMLRGKKLINECNNKQPMKLEFDRLTINDNSEGHEIGQNTIDELTGRVLDLQSNVANSKHAKAQDILYPQQVLESPRMRDPSDSMNGSLSGCNAIRASCSYPEMVIDVPSGRMGVHVFAAEGPSEESTCCNFNGSPWLSGEQSQHFNSGASSSNGFISAEWGKSGMDSPSWGARTVGWSQGKSMKANCGIDGDDYDAFVSIFEGGSLLYCNMSFEALLDVRKRLEDLGFPCKAVNDGLWLQMLLSHKVQEIGADTCRNCCMTSMLCACRQPFGCSQGASTGYHRQEHDRNNASSNVYLSDAQGDANGIYGPVRVNVRGPIDGLAGIGRGNTFVPGAAWPPTRFVFSRNPFGFGNRNCQLSLGNDDPEARIDLSGELSGDGLTALVGMNQSGGIVVPIYKENERAYVAGTSNLPSTDSMPVQMLQTQDQTQGLEWENPDISSISLDMKTTLRQFPPFRFGVEFEDVHRLGDGQVKHSPEVFYAGSLWKVSVQAFNDEDPQGRRTLGLFLHRRKAETADSLRKAHMYVDSREKVTARYQLICPSKREVMVFGSLKQPGTLLPKAPKGWGWRTAILFDELPDLLQSGALRIAAVVQLI